MAKLTTKFSHSILVNSSAWIPWSILTKKFHFIVDCHWWLFDHLPGPNFPVKLHRVKNTQYALCTQKKNVQKVFSGPTSVCWSHRFLRMKLIVNLVGNSWKDRLTLNFLQLTAVFLVCTLFQNEGENSYRVWEDIVTEGWSEVSGVENVGKKLFSYYLYAGLETRITICILSGRREKGVVSLCKEDGENVFAGVWNFYRVFEKLEVEKRKKIARRFCMGGKI